MIRYVTDTRQPLHAARTARIANQHRFDRQRKKAQAATSAGPVLTENKPGRKPRFEPDPEAEARRGSQERAPTPRLMAARSDGRRPSWPQTCFADSSSWREPVGG